jgi:hypothetical protein
MSTHKVQETEAHPLAERTDTQEVIKTTTGRTTSETLRSPRPVRPLMRSPRPVRPLIRSPRPVRPLMLTAAAVTAFAAVALTPWLLTTSSHTETSRVISTSPAASLQQTAPAMGQASAASNAASISGPTAYVMFCQNSPSLCAPPTPLTNIDYLQFCWNSPTLCTLPKRN